MDDPILLIERGDGIATLTLNRPAAMNALSRALRAALVEAFASIGSDPEVDVVILTGAGRAFCAGLDLKELGGEGAGRDETRSAVAGGDVVAAVQGCERPVIGAINGFAITGGFELALMCDILIASTEAKFADTHGRVGLMPVWGLSQKLPRLIGPGRAKELSFTGNFLAGATAERWGLVNRVVAPEELMPAARKLAHDIAQVDGALLKKLKAVTDDGLALPLPDALKLEIQRGSAHNSSVTPAAAEESRKAVMERGREQKG
jgi:enoyl-CoA hydratase